MQARGFGWRPDIPDARDLRYALPYIAKLPDSVDLREHCPPIYDQGQLGSCTAFAITSALEFQRIKEGHTDIHFSELFVYYLERKMEGTVSQDSGAYIRDGMKAVYTYGACPEQEWPYDIARFTRKPSRTAYSQARHTKTVQYSRVVQTGLRPVLASGMPVIFGFSVYDSFMTQAVADSGIAPMPDFTRERVVGGHAVMAVGYTQDTYLCRNQWGESWGQKGYFTLPRQYVEDPNLCDDFWCMQVVQ
jgi:C1A family cysteine protease